MRQATKKIASDEYAIPPKQYQRIQKKLNDCKKHLDASVDDEATFSARYKEVMGLGRQSAKDRWRAGQILIDLEREIKAIGYPFWPWLSTQCDGGIPERTARRAMEIARHFGNVAHLGDRTITEALREAQEAKAKIKAQQQAEHQIEHEGEAYDDAKSESDDAAEEVKLGKESDSVSDGLPSLPASKLATIGEESQTEEEPNEDVDLYSQADLRWDLMELEDLIETILNKMAGDLGVFELPSEAVQQIDHSIELLYKLKTQLPA